MYNILIIIIYIVFSLFLLKLMLYLENNKLYSMIVFNSMFIIIIVQKQLINNLSIMWKIISKCHFQQRLHVTNILNCSSK